MAKFKKPDDMANAPKVDPVKDKKAPTKKGMREKMYGKEKSDK